MFGSRKPITVLQLLGKVVTKIGRLFDLFTANDGLFGCMTWIWCHLKQEKTEKTTIVIRKRKCLTEESRQKREIIRNCVFPLQRMRALAKSAVFMSVFPPGVLLPQWIAYSIELTLPRLRHMHIIPSKRRLHHKVKSFIPGLTVKPVRIAIKTCL